MQYKLHIINKSYYIFKKKKKIKGFFLINLLYNRFYYWIDIINIFIKG